MPPLNVLHFAPWRLREKPQQKSPTNSYPIRNMPNKKKTWKFAIPLSKNAFPWRPASPASRKTPANNLSNTEHSNPKIVEKLKNATKKFQLPLPLP
jgi:hypothetical protein